MEKIISRRITPVLKDSVSRRITITKELNILGLTEKECLTVTVIKKNSGEKIIQIEK